MDTSRIDQKTPNSDRRVYHNYNGPTYNVFNNGPAPPSSTNGEASKQSIFEQILPCGSKWNFSPKPSEAELEHIIQQPPKAPNLCHVSSSRMSDGKRLLYFNICQPAIWRSVNGFLGFPEQICLWQLNYALRMRCREYGKRSQFTQEAEVILRDLETTIRSQLADSLEQNIMDPKEYKTWLCCSIIMLAHGAQATISGLSISYNCRLDHVIFWFEKLTLVFAREDQPNLYREIMVFDLPNLEKQGISLHLDSFLKELVEVAKCEQHAECVSCELGDISDIRSNSTSFVDIDDEAEKPKMAAED
jgi:hypothetical protein